MKDVPDSQALGDRLTDTISVSYSIHREHLIYEVGHALETEIVINALSAPDVKGVDECK